MKISVIVPIYNVAPFVERCLNSVIAQTYSYVECVIVDDCGQDDSMDIVTRRLSNYIGPIEFKVVHHKKNRGLSAARNTGTDAATGEYVYYLDSDDLILSDTLSLLAELIMVERLDFVIGNYASGGDSMRFLRLSTPFEVSRSNQEIMNSYFDRQWYMMAWNKLVNRNFLNENKLRFFEGMIHEDDLWSFQLACKANSMGVVNKLTYVYFQHPASIMNSLDLRSLNSQIRSISEMENFAQKNGLLEESRVVGFVTNYRESLSHRAKVYGVTIAFNVYKNHVRGKSLFENPWQSLSFGKRIGYLHHFLTPRIGYLYHTFVGKFIDPLMKKLLN